MSSLFKMTQVNKQSQETLTSSISKSIVFSIVPHCYPSHFSILGLFLKCDAWNLTPCRHVIPINLSFKMFSFVGVIFILLIIELAIL